MGTLAFVVRMFLLSLPIASGLAIPDRVDAPEEIAARHLLASVDALTIDAASVYDDALAEMLHGTGTPPSSSGGVRVTSSNGGRSSKNDAANARAKLSAIVAEGARTLAHNVKLAHPKASYRGHPAFEGDRCAAFLAGVSVLEHAAQKSGSKPETRAAAARAREHRDAFCPADYETGFHGRYCGESGPLPADSEICTLAKDAAGIGRRGGRHLLWFWSSWPVWGKVLAVIGLAIVAAALVAVTVAVAVAGALTSIVAVSSVVAGGSVTAGGESNGRFCGM